MKAGHKSHNLVNVGGVFSADRTSRSIFGRTKKFSEVRSTSLMCNFGICSRFWDVIYGVRLPNGSPDLLEKFMGRISIDVLFVVLVFNFPPTAKVIWRRGHGLKSHPTDWRSRESNLRPLVYKASGLSTTPQRLLYRCLTSLQYFVSLLNKKQKFALTLKAPPAVVGTFKSCCFFKNSKSGMIFHENRLLADDSHEVSYLIFFENWERFRKFFSSAVVIGVLRVNFLFLQLNINR